MKFKIYQQDDEAINVDEIEADNKEEAIEMYMDMYNIYVEEEETEEDKETALDRLFPGMQTALDNLKIR